MIRTRIKRNYLEYARYHRSDETDHDTAIARLSLKEQMRTNAIHDNGIAKTFCFSGECYDLTLSYIKIEDEDITSYPDMFGKRTSYEHISNYEYVYLHDRTYQSILSSCLAFAKTHEIDDKLNATFEEIRKACVEKYNAVYSSVEILGVNVDKNDNISIPYSYYYIKDEFIDKISSDVIFWKESLPYAEWFTSKIHPINNLSPDSADDPKIIIANPNQKFKIDDDKLCMSLKYGKYTSYSLVMTKEVFQECYNRWIKPQEEGNIDNKEL